MIKSSEKKRDESDVEIAMLNYCGAFHDEILEPLFLLCFCSYQIFYVDFSSVVLNYASTRQSSTCTDSMPFTPLRCSIGMELLQQLFFWRPR